MLQIIQSIDTGRLDLEDVPPPALLPGMVRVRTQASLISAGTERMLIDLAKKSLVGKAQARPDLVKQVLQKVQTEGLLNTYRNVKSKMQRLMPLGYSASGIIERIDEGVTGMQIGDRVAIAGAGYANHAEINVVPKNLVAHIPDGVSFEDASYVTVACIALQGVRLARPELGDNVAVIGLGLIGLMTVQLLKANGCRVIGIDLDATKVNLARKIGIDEAVAAGSDEATDAVERFTGGRGTDRTLIAAATKSNDPIEFAGEITRRKGKVVVVGAVGLDIPRNVYYHKELEVQISMSYGPGRYDASYEEGGVDYPYDYVRWTEQRNMEAVLNLIAERKLDLKSITTHRFEFQNALEAYKLIQNQSEKYVGIVLAYDSYRQIDEVVFTKATRETRIKEKLGIGFVGAGNYATVHLLPHLRSHRSCQLIGLVTATGQNARQRADQYGFTYCTTDLQALLDDDSIDSLFIASRHSTHADYTIRALVAGKHVFVEKPMVVNEEQLTSLCETYEACHKEDSLGLMVGVNRRFSPMVQTLMQEIETSEPIQMVYRVNSGAIPPTTWRHDKAEGGGMLVGEMCHFIDLMQFVCGERPVQVFARNLTIGRADVEDLDNLSIVISFDGGSVGTINYNTVGDKSIPKERFEVFGSRRVAILDDFRTLHITKGGRTRRFSSRNQDKGQSRQITETLKAFRERGTSPIPFDELVAGMNAVFSIRRSIQTGEAVPVSTFPNRP